jgi:D-aminoacyl-tRNA deacylase
VENHGVRVVVQRVREASVTVGGERVSAIGPGLVVLVGVASADTPEIADRLAERVAALRIFENEDGRFDRALVDVGSDALVVSQFTLIADTRKGNRPSFGDAARADAAEPLYARFCETLGSHGVAVARGVFGARMELVLVNDGPVTIVLDG